MRPRLRLDAPWLDGAMALAMAGAGIVDVAGQGREGPMWANVLAMLALGVLVAIRRHRRVTAAYGYVAWLVVMSVALTPPPEVFVAMIGLLLFPYAIAACLRGWPATVYLAVLFAALAGSNLSAGLEQSSDWVFPTLLAVAAYAAGRNMVHRTALAVELHEAALRAREERDAEARRAVAAERRRIAHEMHDVVAHSISVMVVQAGGARRILERDPERAQDAASQIERTGRETLLEMRRLLGVMRPPDESPRLTPNPDLDALEALVDRAREAGLPVDLRVEGTRRPLSPGLELGAYRVVQDALDDVLRVAPTARTHVRVRWSRAALEITVSDDRPYVPFADGAGPSLVGVRERVALYGGDLRTGQHPDGGHEVHVRFPLDDPPGSDPPETNPVPAQGAA